MQGDEPGGRHEGGDERPTGHRAAGCGRGRGASLGESAHCHRDRRTGVRGGECEHGRVGPLVEGDRDGVIGGVRGMAVGPGRVCGAAVGEFGACQLRQQCEFGTRPPSESPVGQPGEGHGAQDCGGSGDGDRRRARIDADRHIGADYSTVDVVGSVVQPFVDGEVAEDRPETQTQTE